MASLLAQRALLSARADTISDIKDTLSSWDKCMAKNYCKWPVIVAIIVGGLIVLSVVLCVARCVCCGAELACCCFKCCTCCCPSGRRKGHERVKSPPPRPYDNSAYSAAPPAPAASMDSRPLNQQYRSHAAPTFNPAPAPTFNPAPATKSEAPQFARFDAHAKPENEDALPAMPSWNEAKSVQVEQEVIPEKHDDVELDRLDHNGSITGTSMAAVAASGATRRSPGPGRSPVQRIPTGEGNGYSQGYQNDTYADRPPHRSPQSTAGDYESVYSQQPDYYRGASPAQSLPPAYGIGAGYAQNQYGRGSPGPGGYPGQQTRRSPGPGYDQYNQYGQQQPPRTSPPLNTNNYGYGNSNPYHEPEVSPVTSNPGMYNNGFAPAPAQAPSRDPSPVYAPSGSTRVGEVPMPSASPAPAYPGQQTYNAAETSSYPTQQPYRAYTPAQTQDQQYSNVPRKAVEGSWKEV